MSQKTEPKQLITVSALQEFKQKEKILFSRLSNKSQTKMVSLYVCCNGKFQVINGAEKLNTEFESEAIRVFNQYVNE